MSLNALGSFRTMVLYNEHIMLFIVSCMLPFKIALLLVVLGLLCVCEELRLSVHIFENEVKISNTKALKMMPTSLQSVNMGMIETGNTPVAAKLCFESKEHSKKPHVVQSKVTSYSQRADTNT